MFFDFKKLFRSAIGNKKVVGLYIGNKKIWPLVTYFPPSYDMMQPLIHWGGMYWVPNNAELPDIPPLFNAKLLNNNGTIFTPIDGTYPMDGTLQLPDGAYADTEFIIPQDKETVIIGVYDIVPATSFKMYAIHYKGNGRADIYEADDHTAFNLKQQDFEWSPPTTSWKIKEGKPYRLTEPVNIKVSYGITPEVTTYILNTMESWTDTDTLYSLKNVTGTDTNITAQLIEETEEFGADGMQTGDDSGFLTDAQFLRGWYPRNKPCHVRVSGLDPTRKYLIRTSGSSSIGNTARRMYVKLNDENMYDKNGNNYIETTENIDNGFEKEITGLNEFTLYYTSIAENDHPSVDGFDIIEIIEDSYGDPSSGGESTDDSEENNDDTDNGESGDDSFQMLAEQPLPPQSEWVDVTDHGLVGDGTTDDGPALEQLAQDTSITNWYFPANKTFLFHSISIPSHVRAIFGPGTIRVKANTTTSDGSANGCFLINNDISDSLIISIKRFENQAAGRNDENNDNPDLWPYYGPSSKAYGSYAWCWYGTITISGHVNINNLEIRDCYFDQSNHVFNCIKIFGEPGDYRNTNMNIHHNTCRNYGNFAFEIIDTERNEDGTSRCLEGCHIHHNDFQGGLAGISFVFIRAGAGNTGEKDGTENYIYRNKETNSGWGFELGGSSGLYCFENELTNIRKLGLYAGQGSRVLAIGKNFIFRNHITTDYSEGLESAIFTFNSDDVYDNYFDTPIVWKDDAYTENEIHIPNGHWYNNIVICREASSYGEIIKAEDLTGPCIIENNKFYGENGVHRGIYGLSGPGGSNVEIKNNKFYLKESDAQCVVMGSIDNPITESDNECNVGWNGEIPTGKANAGLPDGEETGQRL